MPTYADQSCRECGATVFKRIRHDRDVFCSPCAAKRIEQAALDQMFGEGEIYDRWVVGMERAAIRARAGRRAKALKSGPGGGMGPGSGALPSRGNPSTDQE